MAGTGRVLLGAPGVWDAWIVSGQAGQGVHEELGASELGCAGDVSSLTLKSFGSLFCRKETESQRGTVSC